MVALLPCEALINAFLLYFFQLKKIIVWQQLINLNKKCTQAAPNSVIPTFFA